MALHKGVNSTHPEVTEEQERDMDKLAFYLSGMTVDAEYLMTLMARAYTDGLHQGYKMSPCRAEE